MRRCIAKASGPFSLEGGKARSEPLSGTILFRSAAIVLLIGIGTAQASPAFTCDAKGDTWSVQGTSSRKMTCQFTCSLIGRDDLADHVTCSATIGPSPQGSVCEGFQSQRHWTRAELVAETCAVVP